MKPNRKMPRNKNPIKLAYPKKKEKKKIQTENPIQRKKKKTWKLYKGGKKA